jgi:ferredoxin
VIHLVRGLRGFTKELSRTGSMRALWLQVRTGAVHVARALRGREDGDPIRLFLANYGADGVRRPDAVLAAVQLEAQRCLACGLCDLACARIGGAPRIAPMEAVVCASRQAIDVVRLGPGFGASPEPGAPPCAGCAACEAVCPAAIPIARVQDALARLASAPALPAAVLPSLPMATTPGMR